MHGLAGFMTGIAMHGAKLEFEIGTRVFERAQHHARRAGHAAFKTQQACSALGRHHGDQGLEAFHLGDFARLKSTIGKQGAGIIGVNGRLGRLQKKQPFPGQIGQCHAASFGQAMFPSEHRKDRAWTGWIPAESASPEDGQHESA